jgi:hypothetical protein
LTDGLKEESVKRECQKHTSQGSIEFFTTTAIMSLSAAEQKVRKLARLSSNIVCANCGTEKKFGFSTVCIKFFTFVCNDCKSSHQAISHRCKSLTMSSWTDAEVNELQEKGNDYARQTWLKNAPPVGQGGRPKEGDDINVFKRFVVAAYEHKKYFGTDDGPSSSSSSVPGGVAVAVPFSSHHPPAQAQRAPPSSAPRPAVRAPVVTRAAPAPSPAPPPPPPPVADLLDFDSAPATTPYATFSNTTADFQPNFDAFESNTTGSTAPNMFDPNYSATVMAPPPARLAPPPAATVPSTASGFGFIAPPPAPPATVTAAAAATTGFSFITPPSASPAASAAAATTGFSFITLPPAPQATGASKEFSFIAPSVTATVPAPMNSFADFSGISSPPAPSLVEQPMPAKKQVMTNMSMSAKSNVISMMDQVSTNPKAMGGASPFNDLNFNMMGQSLPQQRGQQQQQQPMYNSNMMMQQQSPTMGMQFNNNNDNNNMMGMQGMMMNPQQQQMLMMQNQMAMQQQMINMNLGNSGGAGMNHMNGMGMGMGMGMGAMNNMGGAMGMGMGSNNISMMTMNNTMNNNGGNKNDPFNNLMR